MYRNRRMLSLGAAKQQATPMRMWRVVKLALTAFAALMLLALAACGGSYSVGPGYTPTSSAETTATPGPTRFAYLYSRIDYPLQVALNSGDTVTLTLSPQSDILTVTPAPGQGTGTVGTPIPLPTDLQNYQDIAASVDTQATETGAFTWALVSPERQSLLTGVSTDTSRDYKDAIVFKWDVQAVSAGQNTARIVLHLIYVYLDGSEHDGSIEVSQAPVPMVAVETSALSVALAQLRLPLVGLSGFAGFIALLRYIYNAIKMAGDVAGQVKGAVKVAQNVKGRIGGSSAAQDASTQQTTNAPWQSQRPPVPVHADDKTWPTRRGAPPSQYYDRPWPPLPSGTNRQ